MGYRMNACVTAAILALAALGLAGCDTEETVAAGETSTETTPPVPSMAELTKAVALDQDDVAIVAAALAEWKERFGSGEPGGPLRAHRAGMEFIADVAPSLDNDQLAHLVTFLGAFRDARIREARQARAQKHNALDAEHVERMMARRLEHMEEQAGARAEWLSRVLGLSADQQAAVEAALEASVPERRATLEAVRDGTLSRDAARAAIRDHHEAMSRTLSDILTPEQSERLEILRRLHPRERRG